MIDHVAIIVSDTAASRSWYEAVLSPIGYGVITTASAGITRVGAMVGFGEIATKKLDFFLEQASSRRPVTKPPVHLSLRVSSRDLVEHFYQAARALGGTEQGAPGYRSHYYADYYGAFANDPDGNNIEIVCHAAV